LLGDFTMIAIAKSAFDAVTAGINTAMLETLALFFATGLLVTSVLVLYGPDVSAFELYGNVS
jgi:hypothetical protein